MYLSDLHTVQQSSQMSHVMWITYNMSCIISVVYQPLILHLKQVSDAFPTVDCMSENVPHSQFVHPVFILSGQRLQVHFSVQL